MDAETGAVDAWLAAIGQEGWQGVTLETAASASGLSPTDILHGVGDRTDAVAAFAVRVANEAVLAATAGQTARERLFDGLMRGFDILQVHRVAVLALWESRDPGVAVLVLAKARPGIRRLGSASGVDVGGLRGELRRLALSAIAARAFATWRADDSPDMAATMAALDDLLGRAERAETEGLSPDLLGLPGLSLRGGGSFFDRLPWRRAPDDQALPPSPGLPRE